MSLRAGNRSFIFFRNRTVLRFFYYSIGIEILFLFYPIEWVIFDITRSKILPVLPKVGEVCLFYINDFVFLVMFLFNTFLFFHSAIIFCFFLFSFSLILSCVLSLYSSYLFRRVYCAWFFFAVCVFQAISIRASWFDFFAFFLFLLFVYCFCFSFLLAFYVMPG